MGGVRISHLKKSFRDTPVLVDLTLEIPSGRLLSVLGESGTGKTTLIRAVAGLAEIDEGTIEIGGHQVARPGHQTRPEERRVGIVFQDLALWPHMKVWENVAFPLEGTHTRPERRRRAGELLEAVRLPSGHQRYPHEISGGERRRVALARALVRKPEILLLDEPFSDLQGALRDDLMMMVWDFARDRDVAVLHATHIQEEALAFADRLAVLQDGRIAQEGDPEDVYRRPSSPLVARLLGEMTVLKGRRVEPTVVRTAVGDLRAPRGDSDILVGLRPESVRIDGVGAVAGVVRRRRYLGGRTIYQVETEGESVWATGRDGHRIGETVRLEVDPEGVRPFPELEAAEEGSSDDRKE